MIAIIAGSRSRLWSESEPVIKACPFIEDITEVVCGCARGADRHGWLWATLNKKPVTFVPAWPDQYDWAIEKKTAIDSLVYPEGGYRFGLANGYIRNAVMAKYADALITVWDGKSKGTAAMLATAKKHGLQIWAPEAA